MSNKKPEKILTACLIILMLIMLPVYIGNSYKSPAGKTAVKEKTKVTGSYSILIDTDENMLYLLKNGKSFKSYVCATGKDETPSPLGSFKIVKKSLWGEGFGGYYLGLNCPWGTYGIHGTTDPESVGYDSSHGCFRMFGADIEQLYGYVGIGTPVLITEGCYGIFGDSIRPIGPGMYGADVMAIQVRLRDLGYYKGSCNGKYDARGFVAAIHKFQSAAGLPVSDYVSKKMYASLGFVLIE
jgi:hypothetical protein